ncbi:MAG: signal peptidase I [Polyangiales bacterium]
MSAESGQSNIKTIGSAILLAMFIRIVLFEAFEIEGPSMEPTLLNGDRVVVAKFSYGLFLPFMNEAVTTWGLPSAGDVVIVRSPRDNVDIVKRVVGLPGDVIELRDGVIYRNQQAVPHASQGSCRDRADAGPFGCEWVEEKLGDHTYRISRNLDSIRTTRAPITVEPDRIYVLGDHRDRSNDSRALGTIPMERVKGHVLSIYWSSEGGAAGCASVDGLRTDRIFKGVD